MPTYTCLNAYKPFLIVYCNVRANVFGIIKSHQYIKENERALTNGNVMTCRSSTRVFVCYSMANKLQLESVSLPKHKNK